MIDLRILQRECRRRTVFVHFYFFCYFFTATEAAVFSSNVGLSIRLYVCLRVSVSVCVCVCLMCVVPYQQSRPAEEQGDCSIFVGGYSGARNDADDDADDDDGRS